MTSAPRDFDGLPVTVMGLGLFGGGAAVTRWLASRGARVTVTDLRSAEELAPAVQGLRDLEGHEIRWVFGQHRSEDFTCAALIVANPAVPPSSPWLAVARSAGVPVTTEMALFLERCPARIALITGTQGKSSTSHTLAQLLSATGFRVHLGGNIGRPLIESAGDMQPSDVAVVEISSYQLEWLPERLEELREPGSPARVEVVAVTNVLADHLERHGSLEAYSACKQRVLPLAAATRGTAVLSAEDPRIASWCAPGLNRLDFFPTRACDSGLNFSDGRFRLGLEPLGRTCDLRLRGGFQRENTLMALGMARLLGAHADDLATAIPGVTALPHRLEDLGFFRGHRVWDNGVSTTPDSTLSVLTSIAPGCTLVCGGKAKNLPVAELVAAARLRVRRAIVFGEAADFFGSALRSSGIETWAAPTVEAAVAEAFERMGEGEELLFSPAAASFDAFLNFEQRALAFRRALPPRDGETMRGGEPARGGRQARPQNPT